MTAIRRRLEKLEASCPTDPMARAQAIVRNMSLEEIHAELRACMLKGGYDPTLPHDEAVLAYIARLEAKAPTLSPLDQECVRQEVILLRQGPNFLRVMFPESPPAAEVA